MAGNYKVGYYRTSIPNRNDNNWARKTSEIYRKTVVEQRIIERTGQHHWTKDLGKVFYSEVRYAEIAQTVNVWMENTMH